MNNENHLNENKILNELVEWDGNWYGDIAWEQILIELQYYTSRDTVIEKLVSYGCPKTVAKKTFSKMAGSLARIDHDSHGRWYGDAIAPIYYIKQTLYQHKRPDWTIKHPYKLPIRVTKITNFVLHRPLGGGGVVRCFSGHDEYIHDRYIQKLVRDGDISVDSAGKTTLNPEYFGEFIFLGYRHVNPKSPYVTPIYVSNYYPGGWSV